MANTLNLFRNGAVGFIVWLDPLRPFTKQLCGILLYLLLRNAERLEVCFGSCVECLHQIKSIIGYSLYPCYQ